MLQRKCVNSEHQRALEKPHQITDQWWEPHQSDLLLLGELLSGEDWCEPMRNWEATASWTHQGDIQHTGSLEHQWHVQDSWLLHGYITIIFYFRYELSRTFWNKIGQDIFCLWKCEKIQREQTSLFHCVHKTQLSAAVPKECSVMPFLLSLATSYLHIRQDLTHTDSSALCFTHVCMLREQDMFHMRAHSDHVLVLMDKSTKSGDIFITLICRFSEKLYFSAAFRESTAKQPEREPGVRLPWSVSKSVHFHCFTEVCFEISDAHETD